MRRAGTALIALLALGACSKAARRGLKLSTSGGKPALEVRCVPGDRVRVVKPMASAERRCPKEVLGGELFPLQPQDLSLGRNSFEVAIVSPKGEAIPVSAELDYAPTPEQLRSLFGLGEPAAGADAVTTPPEVEAPFLPGAPKTIAAVVDGDVVFAFKAPAKTRLDVAGKAFTVEGGKPAEVHIPLREALADSDTSAACAALELPARVTRTDGVIHEGKLVVTHTTPRVLRALEDEKPVLPAGKSRPKTALIVRDDGECWGLGKAKVGEVAVVVLVDQLRRDLPPCKGDKEQTPRIALDVAMGAFEPRSGQRRGEKTFMAPAPACPPSKRAAKAGDPASAFTGVDPKILQKWAATLK